MPHFRILLLPIAAFSVVAFSSIGFGQVSPPPGGTSGGPGGTSGGTGGSPGGTTGSTTGGGTGGLPITQGWRKVVLPNNGAQTSFVSYTHTRPNLGSWSWAYPELGQWPWEYRGVVPITMEQHDRVQMELSGIYKFKFEWVDADGRIGAAAINPRAPKWLNLKVTTSADASWPSEGAAIAEVDNYFGDTPIADSHPNSQTWSLRSNGSHIKTMDGSGGVVEFSIPMSAKVDVQGANDPGADSWVVVDVTADAVVDHRSVNISTPNGNYRKFDSQYPAQVTWHKADGTPVNLTYPGAIPEPSPVTEGGPYSTYGTLTVGLPFGRQAFILNSPFATVNRINTPVNFVATVIDELYTVTYAWKSDKGPFSSGATFGNVPDWSVEYLSPHYMVVHKQNNLDPLYPQPQTLSGEAGDLIELEVAWNDGVKGKARRILLLKEEAEPVMTLAPYWEDPDPLTYSRIPFKQYDLWAPAGSLVQQVELSPKGVEWEVVASVTAMVLSSAADVIPTYAAPLSLVGAVIGIEGQFFTPPVQEDSVNAANYNNLRYVYPSPLPEQSNPNAHFLWYLESNPGRAVVPSVYDKYGPNGFIGRYVTPRYIPEGPLQTNNIRRVLRWMNAPAEGQ